MARMNPPVIHPSAPRGEHRLFECLRDDPGTADWIVLHSLFMAEHIRQAEGEVDFLVIIPGMGMLCVEVKSHDRVSVDASGTWWLGGRPANRSPFRQADDQMHSLKKVLENQRIRAKDLPFWYAVWFTNATMKTRPTSSEWHPWQLLDSQDLRRRPISETLTEVMVQARKHLASKGRNIEASPGWPTKKQCDEVKLILRPEFEIAQVTADVRDNRNFERQQFLKEQYEALDVMQDEERVLLTGAAGTGKTFLAIEAAIRASKQGHSVRFVCFNRLLGNWLAEQVADYPGIQVGSLHRAMLDVTGETPPRIDADGWWRERLPELALEALLEDQRAADVLIVDEVQDLCTRSYLDVLDVMVTGGLKNGRCLLFGDFERQAIYGIFGASDGRETLLKLSPDLYKRRLHRNCRNTPRLGEAAELVSGLGKAYTGYRRPDDLIPPVFRFYNDDAEQERELFDALQQLRRDHYHNDDIVVLSPWDETSIARRARDRRLRSRLRSYAQRGNEVGYTTIHAFKGLDAPAVILTDIDRASGPKAEALLYVALSRATDRLFVLAHDNAKDQIAAKLTKN